MWNGNIPEKIYRLRWQAMQGDNLIGYSAWTPNIEGSFRKFKENNSGIDAVISIVGERFTPYETKEIMRLPFSQIKRIDYLNLLVNDMNHCVAMGFVTYDKDVFFALTDGKIYKEVLTNE